MRNEKYHILYLDIHLDLFRIIPSFNSIQRSALLNSLIVNVLLLLINYITLSYLAMTSVILINY